MTTKHTISSPNRLHRYPCGRLQGFCILEEYSTVVEDPVGIRTQYSGHGLLIVTHRKMSFSNMLELRSLALHL